MDSSRSSNPPAAPSDAISDLEARLAFLQMTAADRRRLRAIAPILNAQSDEFVDAFYRHLFSFEATAHFLRDSDVVAQLKKMQQSHLESMLVDELDEAYVQRRRRVGDVHAQLGVSPQMFLGAYNQYLQYGLRQLAAQPGKSLGEFAEDTLSLLKAILLDIDLSLEAYSAQSTQQLRQALDLVFKTNGELRQFAQLTSHDLKTPLATVANLCDETLDEFGAAMPAGACELIEAAKQRTFRMSSMIDELLELSASVDDADDNSEIEAHEVLEEAVDRLGPRLAQRNIELTVADRLPTVWGSRVRLREAFYNLLSNAVKFIDKRPGRIVVSAHDDGKECTFRFSDNGPGIPADDLSRIFSPFRRLKVHANSPGSGLGLYFTKQLIEQQGGRVWAESKLGEGATFCVVLKTRA
jgi:signal transduction histidine kinase